MNVLNRLPSKGFIVIEGPDYSGKTTIAEALSNCLRDKLYKVTSVFNPGCTPLASDIRKWVKDPNCKLHPVTHWLMFQTAYMDLQKKCIEPYLEEGGLVICQRWTDSARVYQHYVQNIPKKSIEAVFRATGTLAPEIIIQLEISDEEAEKRYIQANRSEEDYFEKSEFRKKVRDSYRRLKHDYIRKEPAVNCARSTRIQVDANKPIDEVVEECLNIILSTRDKDD